MVIRLGKHFGFRTLNVVRRKEQAEELLRLGGDAAISTNEESLEERVKALTDGAGVGYAIDAVGGATGSAVVRALGTDGRMLVYGTLAGEPMTIDPRTLMVGHKRVEGFWLSLWVREQNPVTMLTLFRKVLLMLRAGLLTSELGGKFGLADIKAAVKLAETPGRSGKVLLQIP
jgi:NADPH:quinone reductase-like Zn-dependent oxidoreductase